MWSAFSVLSKFQYHKKVDEQMPQIIRKIEDDPSAAC